MKTRFFIGLNIFALALVFALSGCIYTDNQELATKQAVKKTNPAPLVPADSNNHHQVLIAILDSGVDYNHPVLQNHIHYTLNRRGQIVGAGWDYLTNDAWPAPYIARTFDLDPTASPADRDNSKTQREFLKTLVELQPSLNKYLDPDRSIEMESMYFMHGTHVAALASYDIPGIGILPYRVLPVNFNASEITVNAKAFATFIDGVQRAVREGAKIVNMSLGLRSTSSNPEIVAISVEARKKFEKIVKDNPQVVFVAASGNDGSHTTGELDFPCGVDAANIICVTGYEKNSEGGFKPAKGSTQVSSHLYQISAMDTATSAVPSQNCFSPVVVATISKSDSLFKYNLNDKAEMNLLAREWVQECSSAKNILFQELSGTSMASPRVARELAKILIKNKKLSGHEAIKQLLVNNPTGQIPYEPASFEAARLK